MNMRVIWLSFSVLLSCNVVAIYITDEESESESESESGSESNLDESTKVLDTDCPAVEGSIPAKRRSSKNKKCSPKDLSIEHLSQYFDLPINDASKKIGICATLMKKVCRKNGINRWPHRKVRSLKTMLSKIEEDKVSIDDVGRSKIESLLGSIMKGEEVKIPKELLQKFSKPNKNPRVHHGKKL